jgi:acyl-CoA synthetase (NDP forming)
VSKVGYAGLAELVLPSPAIDGVVLVLTARSSHVVERQGEALARLAETAQKPVLLWSYTQPAPKSVQVLSEAGLPLYTDIGNCARAMQAMADYRALRAPR